MRRLRILVRMFQTQPNHIYIHIYIYMYVYIYLCIFYSRFYSIIVYTEPRFNHKHREVRSFKQTLPSQQVTVFNPNSPNSFIIPITMT